MIAVLWMWMALSTFAATQLPGGAVPPRIAVVQWRQVPGATSYDFQLSRKAEMEPILISQTTSQISLDVKLVPGTYYFRVRGRDSSHSPGPWSEVQGFTVHDAPPEPTFPPDRSMFSKPLPATGMPFQWKSKNEEVAIEVRDSNGKVLERTVRGKQLRWIPTTHGDYSWRLGSLTTTGVDWGKPSVFRLNESAFPKPVPTAPWSPLEASSLPEIYENGRSREWGVTLRLSESLLGWGIGYFSALSGSTTDSGSNLVGSGSLELRHRFPRSGSRAPLWTVIASGEVLRILDQNETVWTPRGFVEGHATFGSSVFRWGPLVRVGLGAGNILQPSSNFIEKVVRYNGSVGAMGVYAISPKVYLTLTALARLDMGGTSIVDAVNLNMSPGYEGSLGIQLFLTPGFLIDVRFRTVGEFYSWATRGGNQPNPSYFSNVFYTLDAGVGFRF